MKNIRSELRPGEVDSLNAPEGYYAELGGPLCEGCALFALPRGCGDPEYTDVTSRRCLALNRADGCTVIFKKLE